MTNKSSIKSELLSYTEASGFLSFIVADNYSQKTNIYTATTFFNRRHKIKLDIDIQCESDFVAVALTSQIIGKIERLESLCLADNMFVQAKTDRGTFYIPTIEMFFHLATEFLWWYYLKISEEAAIGELIESSLVFIIKNVRQSIFPDFMMDEVIQIPKNFADLISSSIEVSYHAKSEPINVLLDGCYIENSVHIEVENGFMVLRTSDPSNLFECWIEGIDPSFTLKTKVPLSLIKAAINIAPNAIHSRNDKYFLINQELGITIQGQIIPPERIDFPQEVYQDTYYLNQTFIRKCFNLTRHVRILALDILGENVLCNPYDSQKPKSCRRILINALPLISVFDISQSVPNLHVCEKGVTFSFVCEQYSVLLKTYPVQKSGVIPGGYEPMDIYSTINAGKALMDVQASLHNFIEVKQSTIDEEDMEYEIDMYRMKKILEILASTIDKLWSMCVEEGIQYDLEIPAPLFFGGEFDVESFQNIMFEELLDSRDIDSILEEIIPFRNEMVYALNNCYFYQLKT